jgi:hypothetical protein
LRSSYASSSSNLVVEVFVDHTLQSKEMVGKIDGTVDALVQRQGMRHRPHIHSSGLNISTVISHDFDTAKASKKSHSTLSFYIAAVPESLHHEVEQAKNDVANMDSVPYELLLSKAERFITIVAAVAEVC